MTAIPGRTVSYPSRDYTLQYQMLGELQPIASSLLLELPSRALPVWGCNEHKLHFFNWCMVASINIKEFLR